MQNSLFSKKSFFRLLSFNFTITSFFLENFFFYLTKNVLLYNSIFISFSNSFSSTLCTFFSSIRFFKISNHLLLFPNFMSLYYAHSYFSSFLRKFYIKLFKTSTFGLGRIIRLKGVGYKSYLKNRCIYFRLGRSHWCFSFF